MIQISVYTDNINFVTKRESEIIDITQNLEKIIDKSKVKKGIVNVFIAGSTGSITTIEFEPGLKKDFPEALERISPIDIYYKHHETWNDDNGRSHVKASLIGPSLSLPINDCKMIHGTWQQIVFIEHDTRPRNRKIFVTIIGE